MIRDVVREAFDNERVSQDVNGLYVATKQTLIDDLSIDDFADMFAQTLAYGLFAARVNSAAAGFHWSTAARDIPSANPFLRRVFNLTAGLDAESEPFIGFVDDLSQLLANSDMEAILSDFGRRGARQDPIMHFYETFLAAYDPRSCESGAASITRPNLSYPTLCAPLITCCVSDLTVSMAWQTIKWRNMKHSKMWTVSRRPLLSSPIVFCCSTRHAVPVRFSTV